MKRPASSQDRQIDDDDDGLGAETVGEGPTQIEQMMDETMLTRMAVLAAEQALKASDEKWDSRINKLVLEQDRKFDLKIKTMEERLQAQIDDLKNNRSSAGSTVADRSTLAGSTYSSKFRGPWTPKVLEVKGFASWDNRHVEGITKTEVKTFVEKVAARLDPDCRRFLDTDSSIKNARILSTKVILTVSHTGLAADDHDEKKNRSWALRDAIVRILDSLGDILLNGRTPKVVVEAPPWKKELIKAGAQGLGKLQKRGVTDLQCNWADPLEIFQEVNGRPALVMSWSSADGWSLEAERLRALGINSEDLHKDLKS